jgi:hypothetical protein
MRRKYIRHWHAYDPGCDSFRGDPLRYKSPHRTIIIDSIPNWPGSDYSIIPALPIYFVELRRNMIASDRGMHFWMYTEENPTLPILWMNSIIPEKPYKVSLMNTGLVKNPNMYDSGSEAVSVVVTMDNLINK